MTSHEIRQQFLDFFKSKEHKIVQSAPVVPFDDATLLFTNAGMNQFKDVFLGHGSREYKRAADTQKCIRVSGKHNDLEEVGHDTYHHTFFEMLGNWSFGDYYKAEAIEWAWELLTEVWKLPKERLWATVYKDDDEAFELWKTKTDINPKHILKFGEKDNFWEMGETGPCGPCSEIHINVSDDYNNPAFVNAGVPECIEIWNLVFIQYNRDETGKLHELPAKHVDTGMGFERVCAVMQKKSSNYDTDVFTPLINEVSKLSNVKYDKEEDRIPMRVIADHIRALTFAIADGAVPGNDGRGYVLRRILRRAARYGRKLHLKEPFLYKLVDVLTKTMGDVFPEVKEKKDYVKKVIKAEEESFNATLDRGIELFDNVVKKLQKQNIKVIPGEDVFKLYDTFGFPVDLTNVMAREIGLAIDEDGFNKLMNEQKERSRESSKIETISYIYKDWIPDNYKFDTEFVGYDYDKLRIKINRMNSVENLLIFDVTPFYAEAGGQVGDTGYIEDEKTKLKIINTFKIDNVIVHEIEKVENPEFPGTLKNIVAPFYAQVDEKRRWDIMRNHSATHFLHRALRMILGTHVQQAGSYVGPDRLRFDFSHYSKLSAEEIRDIETIVNEQLRRNLPMIHHRDTPFEEAKKMGAIMFFGDKYGDNVNVVQFGDFTMEFCGGTHVKNSSEIGLFKIISEASIASGVRRIEAVTGSGVEKYIHSQLELVKQAEHRVEELLDVKKKLEKEISELRIKEKLEQLEHIISIHSEEKGVFIHKGRVHADSMDELKSFGDELRNKIKSGICVLIAQVDDKVGIVAIVSDDLIKQKNLSAGKIVGELAKLVGGGGGGRPHLATAGGKDVSKIPNALSKVESIVSGLL
ncbi:MAG: alanine--tRNA ligase [Ignavibacterium sp.]|nr:alanine--tRNA ligase [Ignavibacterium sp.]